MKLSEYGKAINLTNNLTDDEVKELFAKMWLETDFKKELNNNQTIHNRKKEKIIKDLKLKGYNEREITEIFLSNSIDKEISEKVEEEKHQSINLNKNIIVAVNKNIKTKHKKFNYNSSNSRPNLSYKNTLLVKTENSEYKTKVEKLYFELMRNVEDNITGEIGLNYYDRNRRSFNSFLEILKSSKIHISVILN